MATHDINLTESVPRNGFGITALVSGIVGVLFGLAPITFWIAGPLAVIALVFGLLGRGRAKRGEATNKTMSTWGAILGLAAAALSIVGAVIFFKAVNDTANEIDKTVTQYEDYTDCLDQTPVENWNICDSLMGE